MMNDQDLEARLTAYRPVGPPSSLRTRVVGEPAASAAGVPAFRPARRSALAWLPAVAAMLLAATFYWLAASGRERIFAQLPAVVTPAIDLNLEARP
jgi:hypothetical protein